MHCRLPLCRILNSISFFLLCFGYAKIVFSADLFQLYDTYLYMSTNNNTKMYNIFMDLNFNGNRIAELRNDAHMSQRQLAKEIGTSQANLSRWEQGIIIPSILECWRLAEYFGVSIDYLCGKSDI